MAALTDGPLCRKERERETMRLLRSLIIRDSRIIDMVKMAPINNLPTTLSENDDKSLVLPTEVQISIAVILGLWMDILFFG